MKKFIVPAVSVLCLCATFVSAAETPPSPGSQPLGSGLDETCFDKSVRPQDDLFRAVNGRWLEQTKIPADRSTYGSFELLIERTEEQLRDLIEHCASATGNAPGSLPQKIGDLYASFLDEDQAQHLGMTPIAAQLTAVGALRTKADIEQMFADLTKSGIGGPFGFGVDVDARHSDRHILGLGQAGLHLPDRDYYLDPKFQAKREAYQAHVERMLTLAKIAEPRQAAVAIVDLETQIARIQWSKVENRDADKTYNKMGFDGLVQLTPHFDWRLYLDGLGVKDANEFNVAQPSYFTAFDALWDKTTPGTWQAWLSYHVIHSRAAFLSKEFVDADFEFYSTTLRDVPQNRPRWKRGVALVDGCLGEAVGQLYVARYFPPEARQRVEAMVGNVTEAYRRHIEKLDWMSPVTREKALAKLSKFTAKIGYPKKWRDYSALEIHRGDLIGNLDRCNVYEWNRMLAKLGHPVDRDEWYMPPQTVNAYYSANKNEIVFPAAILQPPFFNFAAEDAVNYGGIGAVIGHEMGHGFDDQGSKWDGAGNLNSWWTPADRAEFDRRGSALAAQYSQFEPFPGFKVNGRLTLGENLADLAGLTMAYDAYHLSLDGKPPPVIDGLTGDQRFFMGFAQIWRRLYRDADLKSRLVTDPHSPTMFRANGTPRNVPAFYQAFNVAPGDKMYLPPEERIKVW